MSQLHQHRDFGVHLMLDLSGCDRLKLADLDLIYHLLDTTPDKLSMTKVIPPYVFRYSGKVQEDQGITGFVVIAESHVSIHTFQEKGYAFVDVFSCKPFDCTKAEQCFVDALGAREVKRISASRGDNFPRTVSGG